MTPLESQVAKIQIGNFKQTSSYVLTLAEKAQIPDCELYAVVELPLFNPAALGDCERIANAIAATLKRSYRKTPTDTTFEIALAEINEEFGKLSTLGQTNWVGKLNSIIAVKCGDGFNIATTGKVTALLLRNGELSDIADNHKAKHPLKTFENFATGKLKKDDFLILSTAELFNHISVDRLTEIITQNPLSLSAQKIVGLLEDNAGPETAFGTLLIYEGEVDQGADETVNLEDYLPPDRSLKTQTEKAKKFFAKHLNKEKVKGLSDKVKNVGKGLLNKKSSLSMTDMATKTKENLENLASSSKSLGGGGLQKLKVWGKPQKFFAISAGILAIIVVVNIFLAKSFKDDNGPKVDSEAVLTQLEQLVGEADGNLLYENEDGAMTALTSFYEKSATLTDLNSEQEKKLAELTAEADEIRSKLDKNGALKVENLGSLSASDHLIVLPNYFATAIGENIIAFDRKDNSIIDGSLKTTAPILQSQFTKGNNAVIFDGQGLSIWNFSTGSVSTPTYLSVPASGNLIGLTYYPVNEKVYLIDTAKKQIFNYEVSDISLGAPVAWIGSTEALADSLDMAIDGDVYVLTKTGVDKYSRGKPANFSIPSLADPFSGDGKIFTTAEINNIYILDIGKKRIIIIDKEGNLVQILTNSEITNPQDFTVDEANKTIYILNNGSLLKATF